MPTLRDVEAQVKFLMDRGRADEPAKLLLPRVEAKRRATNKEKRTRVVFDATPEQYAAFHAQLKRYRELIGNVTIAHDVIVDLLAAVQDETILGLAEHTEAL